MASVTFESFIKENKSIEIPIIQRDYVQGRGLTIEEQDKREAFVTKLINAITDDKVKRCHLEFIYGVKNETSKSFVPLDGQQRLTTLFLLHWVIWNMSSSSAKESHPLDLDFKYETRLSSLAFCQNLVSRALLPIEGVKSIGEQIRKQPWFSEDWNFDPTIMAMISMIDFMQEKLSEFDENQITTMLEKLCSSNNIITFDELNMSYYDLSDSLYIKMNARGKQLTPFENWKSEFIKYLETEFGDKKYQNAEANRKPLSCTYSGYFSYSIEHEWTDLFWSYSINDFFKLSENERETQYPSIDKMFMNLFDSLCIYHYYAKGNTDDYTKISAATKRKIWQNEQFIKFFFATLDSLYRIANTSAYESVHIGHTEFFNKLFYTSECEVINNEDCRVRLFRTKECNLFKLCVENGSSMELMDILLFYALLSYCNEHKVTQVDDKVKYYMRQVRDCFENEIQNLRTRTIVQSDLRFLKFNDYDSKIEKLINSEITFNEYQCIIGDCSLTHGIIDVFDKSIEEFGYESVVKALRLFCETEVTERIRLLIACGFKGTKLGSCIGRERHFFGNKEKWDVLFVSDKEQLSQCFYNYTKKIINGSNNKSIIENKLAEGGKGFVYYMLQYEDFLSANKSLYHFAVRGDINDVDWIALGTYNSKPGTAYHADPFVVVVEKILRNKDTTKNLNLTFYKQHRGKGSLIIVKDKNNFEPLFSVLSRKEGWYIDDKNCFLTEDIKARLKIQEVSNNGEYHFLIPKDEETDMVETCVNLMEEVSKLILCQNKTLHFY